MSIVTFRQVGALLATLAMAMGLMVVSSSPASAATALPGTKPNYVVSVMGGSRNAYFTRIGEYTFKQGATNTGTVSQRFWYWNEATFTGDASVNKVRTGYASKGGANCNNCELRTAKGFQPGGNGKTLTGTYYFDSLGQVVINWTGSQRETWRITRPTSSYAKLQLINSNYNLLKGDGYGSHASFSTAASRDVIKNVNLQQVMWSASYCKSLNCPKSNNGYIFESRAPIAFSGTPYMACSGSPCLSHTVYGKGGWRSIFTVPPGQGRRAFYQAQLYGVDGYTGVCFSPRGFGHTWALLQAIDDHGKFLGFVGSEASFHSRNGDGMAVVSQATFMR